MNVENLHRPGAQSHPINLWDRSKAPGSLVNKLEKAKLNCLTTVLRFGSEQGYLEEIPHFCLKTLLPKILKHIGMGGKKTPNHWQKIA